jgi:hypothetical protein
MGANALESASASRFVTPGMCVSRCSLYRSLARSSANSRAILARSVALAAPLKVFGAERDYRCGNVLWLPLRIYLATSCRL